MIDDILFQYYLTQPPFGYVKVFCFRILFLFLISFVFRSIIMRDAYLLMIFYTNYFLVYDMLNISALSLSRF